MLNVALGGTLVPDLPTIDINHKSPGLGIAEETHPVRIATDSTVFEIYGAHVEVNSLHHQAVDRLGPGLTPSGWAPDGVVEAVEMRGRPIVGVQWHPEWRRKDPSSLGWSRSLSRERKCSMELHEYSDMDATDLKCRLDRKEVTPAEVREAALAAISHVDTHLGATVGPPLDPPPTYSTSGPFSGVPFALKDLLCTAAGIANENGSAATAAISPHVTPI